ncbi:hypothetical protein M011DRAFT_466783 [Sporormia fimetaria CBS 119925]|uniref:Zn(2)-C6 fungal-type domain-containing protein n=1 Tax=Sporormia fimetaria CBS 119925 TaxID=1340428 RepID=A0A6A6VF20_9PLEO|nr:hypothetical protein M011DRAFT_466783 [Sporormia fimetaria CBS 119925]
MAEVSSQAGPSNGSANKPLSTASTTNTTSTVPNPRSCVTCRKRKVKCDKKRPCNHCVRQKIECVFPGPGRAPRKLKRPETGELLDRLRRLEGVVRSLNAQVEKHEQEDAERERHSGQDFTLQKEVNKANAEGAAVKSTLDGLENKFGRLVVDHGRSRHINNSFWASLDNEVEDLKAILMESSDDGDESFDSPESHSSVAHHGFMFGYSSLRMDLDSLHPPSDVARTFWDLYKENVDPLVKVLHVPTFESVFLDACSHLHNIPKGLECFVFTVYYGAVTSISDKECQERFGEEREDLLARYRSGVEQALARANFLHADETIILQALVVFLIVLRRNEDPRILWTLTGLAIRIAQALGLHRDAGHFGLPPFEVEMRRRLWWHVCALDARASEDHGCDPTIAASQYDTKLPLNINDSDIHPDMTEYPDEREGFTDMTFCLLRFELLVIYRTLFYIPPSPTRCTEFFANLTIQDKEKWISDNHQRLEDKYLKNADMSVPMYWVAATVSRLVMSKMWLIVYHPEQRRDGGASLSQETKDKLFLTSLENLEYSILLETETRTMKWGWLFRTYIQWHAIAFLLSELCVRTEGEAVERAWRALETAASLWWSPLEDSSANRRDKGRQEHLWKPLLKLMKKAKTAREMEMARDLQRRAQAGLSGYPGVAGHQSSSSSSSSATANGNGEHNTNAAPPPPQMSTASHFPATTSSSWSASPAFPGSASTTLAEQLFAKDGTGTLGSASMSGSSGSQTNGFSSAAMSIGVSDSMGLNATSNGTGAMNNGSAQSIPAQQAHEATTNYPGLNIQYNIDSMGGFSACPMFTTPQQHQQYMQSQQTSHQQQTVPQQRYGEQSAQEILAYAQQQQTQQQLQESLPSNLYTAQPLTAANLDTADAGFDAQTWNWLAWDELVRGYSMDGSGVAANAFGGVGSPSGPSGMMGGGVGEWF